MSLCKLTTVKKAQHDQGTCGACGITIRAGDAYIWWKGRYTPKYIRCTKPTCAPMPWDRETNPLRAEHMHAAQLVSDVIGSALDELSPDESAATLQEATNMVQGICDTLDERLSSWQGTGFENGAQYESCESTKYELESWLATAEGVANELEGIERMPHGDDESLAEQIEEALSSLEEVPELDLGA